MRTEIASRELRNNTAETLRRVEAGDDVVITTRGKPVAALVALPSQRRRWMPRQELVRRLGAVQADFGLRAELGLLAGETTGELGPLTQPMAEASRCLLDTSVFIANETGRPLDAERMPQEAAVSAVTIAELQLGVLAAKDIDTRARRLATLDAVGDIEMLPVDEKVAASWALLRLHLAHTGRKLNVNDLWIAAIAHAHDIPVVTHDDDFGAIDGAGGLGVISV